MNFPSKDLVGDELHEQAPTLPLIRLGGGAGFTISLDPRRGLWDSWPCETRASNQFARQNQRDKPASALYRSGFTLLEVATVGGFSAFPSKLLERYGWRSEMRRSIRGRIPCTRDGDSKARGCERLERESGAGDSRCESLVNQYEVSLNAVTGPKRSEATDVASIYLGREHEYPRGCSASLARSLLGFHLPEQN